MRYLYVLYCSLLFISLFLLLFPVFLLLSFFGKKGRKATWYVVKGWSYVWFTLIGMWVKCIYQAKPQKGRHYIVVANHTSYIDTPLIFRTIPFFVRPLAKTELSRVPLFGFLYRQLAVLVDRSDSASKAKSVRLLRETLDKEGSIFIFPEGTFNETEQPLKNFYDGAFRLALETRTPILPVIYPDAVLRWHYRSFWSWSPGLNRAVILPEVDSSAFLPDNTEGFRQEVFAVMKEALCAARR